MALQERSALLSSRLTHRRNRGQVLMRPAPCGLPQSDYLCDRVESGGSVSYGAVHEPVMQLRCYLLARA